jgi:hypothetical protein
MCVLKVCMAVWLTTPLYWNMTLRLRVIESRNFEKHSTFVFQDLVMVGHLDPSKRQYPVTQ